MPVSKQSHQADLGSHLIHITLSLQRADWQLPAIMSDLQLLKVNSFVSCVCRGLKPGPLCHKSQWQWRPA